MAKVEQLHRRFNNILSVEDIGNRLDQIEREIRIDWERYKQARLIRHGEEIKDNGLRMVLVWMIKRGLV